jgi:hypothetical protein
LIPYISNGPLIFWMYPVFEIRGASWFLGCSEWLFGTLLFLGFWSKKLGILGALGSTVTFITTVTIIPFMPNGWAASAGGLPAMAGNVPFLMKDVVLLAASFYLLRQDILRVSTFRGTRLANIWYFGKDSCLLTQVRLPHPPGIITCEPEQSFRSACAM